MNELDLNQADKNRIKDEIKLALILGAVFTIALIVVVLIVPTILFLLDKTSEGFLKRGIFIISLLSLPLVVIDRWNFFKYLDLKRGKKINFSTSDYDIRKEGNGFVLRTTIPFKGKFNVYDEIPALIRLNEPLIIETTKLGKILLYISQDNENLLEKVEKEND